MTKDYYVVLGVTRGADLNKIKKAYRNMVKKHHPDMVSESESTNKFLEAKDAYETLSNEKSRRLHDQELERRQSKPKMSSSPELIRQQSSGHNDVDSFTSAVDEFFGGFVPGFFPDFFEKERSKGKELFLEVVLTPHEASKGGLFPIAVPIVAPCPRCSSSGFWEDFFCSVCEGKGRVRSEQEFSLSIPPHVKHGTQIRLSLEDIGLRNVSINITIIIDRYSEKLW